MDTFIQAMLSTVERLPLLGCYWTISTTTSLSLSVFWSQCFLVHSIIDIITVSLFLLRQNRAHAAVQKISDYQAREKAKAEVCDLIYLAPMARGDWTSS